MPSRFWRASGNALLPGCNVLGAAAAVGTTWDPAAKDFADYTFSNGNLTALRNATGAFWGLIFGTTAKTSGTVIFTVDAAGTGTFGPVYLGYATAVEAQFPGLDGSNNSIGIRSDGVITYGGGGVSLTGGTGGVSYTTGDKIKITRAGSVYSFYKFVTGSYSFMGSYDTLSAPAGASATYPCFSNGNGTGTQITGDFSGW